MSRQAKRISPQRSLSIFPSRGLLDAQRETAARPHRLVLAVTDDERLRKIADLIIKAYRLSDTSQLAELHRLLGLVAIEAARQAPVSLGPIYPPGVVPLRWSHPLMKDLP
jgi:hypothetical protein